MNSRLLIFLIALLAGLFSIGGFLWSAMQEKPQKLWLLGAAAAILVGIAGLITHK